MNKGLKPQILQLRKEGKSYNEIVSILSCSKSTVCYHCGEGQKLQKLTRNRKHRKEKVIISRVYNFQNEPPRKRFSPPDSLENAEERLKRKAIRFQCKKPGRKMAFNWKDVIDCYGWKTTCYLTGKPLNLKEPSTYQFDHIIPCSKGGESTLNNMAIASKEANQAKNDMTPEEFFQLCKEVLEHNGYEVNKKQP